MEEFDFFDTPITPYTVLQDGAEVEIHIRDTATMEQHGVRAIVAQTADKLPGGTGAKLNVYGRLGERIKPDWLIHILKDLEEGALATDHVLAQSQDIEHSMQSSEQFKESRYRKKED
jgi:hypothetical protein